MMDCVECNTMAWRHCMHNWLLDDEGLARRHYILCKCTYFDEHCPDCKAEIKECGGG